MPIDKQAVKKIILRSHMLLGDSIQCTPLVRDLKKQFPLWKIRPETAFQHIWDNNPHIDEFDGGDIYNVGPKLVTQSSKTSGLHFTNGFRMSLEVQLDIPIKQGLLKPELFLSEYEKNKVIIEGHYWVINIDCGPYAAKRWFDERWQEVVNRLPWITFVQIGLSKDNTYRLKGDNVIDYIGKTDDQNIGLRDLFILVYHSQGCLSLVSSLMHIAAAFEKPCVIPAGSREPVTFEGYQWHRYLHKTGCLPCAKTTACWACSKAGCFKKWFPFQSDEIKQKELGEEAYKTYKDKKQKFNLSKWADDNKRDWRPKCMEIISSNEVVNAIESYYDGEILKKPESKAKMNTRKIFRIVSNGSMLGGAERSMIEIIKMAQERNYDVELATRNGVLCSAISDKLSNVKITNKITSYCDILLLYASDMIWDFDKEEFNIFNNLQAKRKIMALTYHIGKSGEAEWTKKFDEYLFLSSDLRDKFLKKLPDAKTKVLAPPVDLSELFKIQPDYNIPLHILRHSSQGDKKYSEDINDLINKCNAKFSFMPAPTFLADSSKVTKYSYNQFSIKDFLSKGNLFVYRLPKDYQDQGPRVVMEALAAGLPAIANNHSGCKDRINKETGWLCDTMDEYISIINSLTPEILKKKGIAAKERAKQEFRKENWIEAIIEN